MKILIDNGHGIDTKGKRSPDDRLLEYTQNRLLAGFVIVLLRTRRLLDRFDAKNTAKYCKVPRNFPGWQFSFRASVYGVSVTGRI